MIEKKLSIGKIIISIFILGLVGVLIFLGVFLYNIRPVDNGGKNVEIIIAEGESYSTIGDLLYEKELIRSEFYYKLYLKVSNPTNLKAGTYILSDTMDLKSILNTLEKGNTILEETITLTFPEGKNIRGIAKIIEEKSDNTYEDFINTMSDKEYIDTLIEKYWFLTDSIKQSEIYYPLEGYLFPDTYQFYKDVSIKTIIETMLDNMEKKLEEYKEEIEDSSYSIHELMTFASIVELEGATSKDRSGVAGVFYNRLNDGWTLGSDVTTYYAEKIDDWSIKLKVSQLNKCNAYNTRGSCVKSLPIGPICNPGIESLKSTINPDKHNKYYFVADCSGNTTLNVSEASHIATINKLKRENNWCDS